MKKLTFLALIIYFISFTFEAPIRFLLSATGLAYAFYLREVLLLLVVLFGFYKIIVTKMINKYLFFSIVIVSLAAIMALINSLNIYQILFGLKAFLPFFSGFVFAYYFCNNFVWAVKIYRIFIPIIFFGLILDYFFYLPWNDFTYLLGEFNIEGNRGWSIAGITRLSGFQRTSFDSAILIFVIQISFLTRRIIFGESIIKFYDFLIFIMAIISILLTTTKSAYFALIVFILVVIVYKLKDILIGKTFSNILLKIGMIMIFLYNAIPPLLSFLNSRLFSFGIETTNLLYRFFLSSYIVRVSRVWPDAFELLSSSNSSLLGRGIGGIGVAQMYFEPLLYNPADNFIVYIFVTFGVLGLTLALIILFKLIITDFSNKDEIIMLFLLLSILTFGGTINVIESFILALSSGIFLGSYSKRKLLSKKPM